MGPARSLLLFLILVALHAQAAQAAPWRAQEAAVPVGEGDPALRLGSRRKLLGEDLDVPVGRIVAVPQMDAPLQPHWRLKGPAPGKDNGKEGRMSLETPETLQPTWEDLEGAQAMDREPVQKEVSPEGSGGSLPVPAEETDLTQATSTPVLSEPKRNHHGNHYAFLHVNSDVVDELSGRSMDHPQSTAGVLHLQDVQKQWKSGTAAIVLSVPVAVILCCAFIMWCLKKRREKSLSASPESLMESGSLPMCPNSRAAPSDVLEQRSGPPDNLERWSSHPDTLGTRTQRQEEPAARPERASHTPSPWPPQFPCQSVDTLQCQQSQRSTPQPRQSQCSPSQPQAQVKQPSLPQNTNILKHWSRPSDTSQHDTLESSSCHSDTLEYLRGPSDPSELWHSPSYTSELWSGDSDTSELWSGHSDTSELWSGAPDTSELWCGTGSVCESGGSETETEG